jgi:hypothetical protein
LVPGDNFCGRKASLEAVHRISGFLVFQDVWTFGFSGIGFGCKHTAGYAGSKTNSTYNQVYPVNELKLPVSVLKQDGYRNYPAE